MSQRQRRAIIIEDEPEFQIALTDAVGSADGNWATTIFSRGHDALSFVSSLNTELDLALVDLGLPDVDGIEVVKNISGMLPGTPCLVITSNISLNAARECLIAGAVGYIFKDDEVFSMAQAINLVIKGHAPINTRIVRDLLCLLPKIPPTNIKRELGLSRRECELLYFLSDGLSYSQAAHEMGLTLATVQSYSRNLFRKLGVNSQLQAIKKASSYGLLQKR